GGSEPPFAFTTGTPWLPQPAGWSAVTAEAQAGDPSSTLTLYRTALAMRPEFASAGFDWRPGDDVLAFARGDRFVCTVNASSGPAVIPCPGTIALSSTPIGPVDPVTGDVVIPADTTVWWKVEGQAR
ncbi:MAG TPA: alpha-glucosidase, partial [Micromonosporaceae bacterium]